MGAERLAAVLAAALLALLPVTTGCRSAAPPPPSALDGLDAALVSLRRPLPETMAALYRLRVPTSGGLRLTVLTRGGDGRLSINEPFGTLVSVTSWSTSSPPRTADLRAGCTLEAAGLGEIFGLHTLPMTRAVLLLGGRLPAVADDQVSVSDAGVVVTGAGCSAAVQLAADPWRVVRVFDHVAGQTPRWSIELRDHSSSVPGFIRFDHLDGRWAELELVRLEWDMMVELPPLPSAPPCAAAGGSW